MKKFSANLFYKFLDLISDIKIPNNSGDFRLMDRRIVDAFKKMPERARYIRGMISWIGYRQKPIEYKRLARSKGETKYTLNKMLNLASNGIISFSKTPLKIAFLNQKELSSSNKYNLARDYFEVHYKQILIQHNYEIWKKVL